MNTTVAAVVLAILLDSLIGDPHFISHPVIWIGKFIQLLEKRFYSMSNRPAVLYLTGSLVMMLTVGFSGAFIWVLIQAARSASFWLAFLLNIWFISTTIAGKGLAGAGRMVYQALSKGDLAMARIQVGQIVGRDTDRLSEQEVVRAAVETLAENITDAIVAPVFWGAIGGAPLAIAYRAANTLDSMLGYRNERYQHFGWASARFDDVVNFIPARITGCLLLLATMWYRLNLRGSLTALVQDAGKHPSPNSGIPEACVAGALGIQLGGTNFYNGVPSQRALMGRRQRAKEPQDILRTIRLIRGVTVNLLVLLVFIGSVVRWH